MKSTLELASDSLRSSVSSPGIPKTYLTPSTSKHSTNRSDALRSMPETSPLPLCRANVAVHPFSMRARTLLLSFILCLAAAAPASAAKSKFTIRGAGFGHGVGMSQYGAYGFALNGSGYRDILAHYYTGTAIGGVDPNRRVRVLLQSAGTASFTGATRAGRRRVSPSKTYYVRRSGASVQLLSPRRRRMGTYTAMRVTGRGGMVTLRGRAGNGRVNGAYRGAMDFSSSGSGVSAINALSLDSYLRGVVPDESPPSWPIEALKAQAVAARTYAITGMKPAAGFDHYADTRSQVYGGVAAEEPSTDAGDRADARRGRDLQRPAGRHLLLLDVGRAHRGRREHAARERAAGVAEVRRRSLRRRLAAPSLGPDPADPRAGRPQARLARQGHVPRHRGRAAAGARRGSWRPR